MIISSEARLQEEAEAECLGQERTAEIDRKGGREGWRELDALSQSATQAWSRLHVICVARVSKCLNGTGNDEEGQECFRLMHQVQTAANLVTSTYKSNAHHGSNKRAH